MRAELAAERDHRAAVHALLTNKGQTPVERLITYAMVFEVASATSRGKTSADDPEARPVSCVAIGETIGLGHQTVSANITRFDQRGQLRKVTSEKLSRTGKTYNEIAVVLPGDSPLENLRAVATWRRPEGTPHVGGNGERCPNCAGTETKKSVETKTVETTTLACADCGHIHTQTRHTRGIPTTTYSYSQAATDIPTALDTAVLAARRPPTLSSVDTPPEPEATPTPPLSTLGEDTGPSAADTTPTWKDPVSVADTPPRREGRVSTVDTPLPVAAWAGTHPCGECGATCYAPAGTVPRCLPCRRARDAGGDVAAGGG